ncbi:MAG TPA: SDR family oxidoreductase [Steroidobacteraceae bacterium]|jgi:NAD(P)-dependent dehydrogenase (short-subunit alcohol dehydrogenase family)|nr:SDR family oxidoreductase [Steroidobacteraceae bacterium]
MGKKDQNASTRAAALKLGRREFLGSSAVAAAGMGAVFAGLGRNVVAQNAPAPAAAPGAPGYRPGGTPPPEPAVSQPPTLKDLKGKVAYVTAASDGIGLGIARAASNAGMKVVIGYRNEERLKAALPLFKAGNAGVLAIKHDVTDRDGWKALLDEINSKFGNLHLVVNNAGIKTLRQASQAKYDEWDNAVAVNFTAIYNSVAACLPHMLKHGEGGHFVTTASMGGLLPGVNAGVYTSTKIAAVGIMESLRVELESTTVGTSVFCPGIVSTDNYPMGEENPFRVAQRAKSGAPVPPPQMAMVGMDPLEAGERVLNGVVNNDLFILSHPEFKAGMQERFDAIMLSTPAVETPIPQARIDSEKVVMRQGIYERELVHRAQKRKSYREA